MHIEQVKQTQMTLLAKKSLIMDELKQIDTQLGQLAAIIQFSDQSQTEADTSKQTKPKARK